MPPAGGFRDIAITKARKHGIPAPLFLSLISVESRWNPRAVSKAGAIGLGQLMPETARGLGVNPWDPAQNLEGAARYLAEQKRRFGTWRLALAAYHAGPNAVAQGRISRETTIYVANVLRGARGERGAGRRRPGNRQGSGIMPQAGNRQGSTIIPLSRGLSIVGPGLTQLGAPTQVATAPAQRSRFTVLRQGPQMTVLPSVDEIAVAKPSPYKGEVAKPSLYKGTKASPAVDVDIPSNEPINPRAARVIKLAYRYLGTPYKWGGASPSTGFDCSGFVQWLYAAIGIDLPRTTWSQLRVGRPVSRDALQPGDLLFFSNGSHEGLYIGHGQFIHAPRTGDVVKISSLNDPWYSSRFLTARRIL